MAAAEEVLRQGQALVLFPEGTRQEGSTIETLHDGAMFIAARTGAIGGAGRDWGQREGDAARREVPAIREDPHRRGRAHRAAVVRGSRVAFADHREERRTARALERLYRESMRAGPSARATRCQRPPWRSENRRASSCPSSWCPSDVGTRPWGPRLARQPRFRHVIEQLGGLVLLLGQSIDDVGHHGHAKCRGNPSTCR